MSCGNAPCNRAAGSGSREEKQEYIVSNDARRTRQGGSPAWVPSSRRAPVLFIRYDGEGSSGKLKIREAGGTVLVDGLPGPPARIAQGRLADPAFRQSGGCGAAFPKAFSMRRGRRSSPSMSKVSVTTSAKMRVRSIRWTSLSVAVKCSASSAPAAVGKAPCSRCSPRQLKPTRGRVNLNGISLYDQRKRPRPLRGAYARRRMRSTPNSPFASISAMR